MSTFVLIHGAGGSAWDWHRVDPLLRAAGHDVVAVDLPCEDEDAGLEAYAETVVRAASNREDLVIVGQSLGGFTAPIAAHRLGAREIVLLAAMIPRPGETGSEWWEATGYPVDTGDLDPVYWFLNDVPDDVIAESAHHVRDQSDRPMRDPWPLPAWPDIHTRFIQPAGDRFFPAGWMREVVRDRLGLAPEETPGGHTAALGRPRELAALLVRRSAGVEARRAAPA